MLFSMLRVLMIENNDELRKHTAAILEQANYKVNTATNCKLATELALKYLPNLILCDMPMPEADGDSMVDWLQENKTLKNIPVIFLIAKQGYTYFKNSIRKGADEYITKPFSDKELLTVIENRLKKATPVQSSFETMVTLQLPDEGGNVNALLHLAESSAVNFYKKKSLIYREGNHPVKIFYVQKGKVKTFKTNDDGKELILGLFGEGDYVGYTAILEGTRYKETTEALEDTTICIIDKEAFEKLLQTNKEVAQYFIYLLAQSVTDREKQLVGIAYNSLRKRVAEALLLLKNKFTKVEEEKFSMHISRENLAHIAGTATESITRTLSDFKSEKLIDIKEGLIILLDEKRLAALIN
jgi:CRP/FNR family transcriptional regulator, cyclic AMP receptor protein